MPLTQIKQTSTPTPAPTTVSSSNATAQRTPLDLYMRYALAGAQCCSITHTVLVPIDVVKTRLQVQSGAYKGMVDAFTTIARVEGYGALLLGLGPTAIGYAIQGACKFGFYEFFKSTAASALGKEKSQLNTPTLMLSAGLGETIATIALCPWEALRIKMVDQPTFASNMVDGFRKLINSEGAMGFYKGLGPILMKQVPYTVTQLVVFHHAMENLYKGVLPRFGIHKENLSVSGQLSVSVAGGIIAGVAGALVSHPADTILSRVNMKGAGSLSKTIYDLGLRGVWLGVGPRCLMVGVLSAGMFLIYDSVKVMCGLPTTGGH